MAHAKQGTRTLTLADGSDVDVSSLGRIDEETIRVEVDGPDGRWQLQVTEDGEHDLEVSWDSDDRLADVQPPNYLTDALELIGTRV